MPRKRLVLLIVALTAVSALPVWNRLQFASGNLTSMAELNLQTPVLRIGGMAHDYMQTTFEQYAILNDWNVKVQKNMQSADYDTEVILYFGLDMLAEIPHALEICGERCQVEPDTALLTSTITDMGLFFRKHKIIYFDLEPLQINGEVEGERFDCVMERIYLETQHLIVEKDPCENLYTTEMMKRASRVAVDVGIDFPLPEWLFSSN